MSDKTVTSSSESEEYEDKTGTSSSDGSDACPSMCSTDEDLEPKELCEPTEKDTMIPDERSGLSKVDMGVREMPEQPPISSSTSTKKKRELPLPSCAKKCACVDFTPKDRQDIHKMKAAVEALESSVDTLLGGDEQMNQQIDEAIVAIKRLSQTISSPIPKMVTDIVEIERRMARVTQGLSFVKEGGGAISTGKVATSAVKAQAGEGDYQY